MHCLLNEILDRFDLKTMIANYKYIDKNSKTYPDSIASLNNKPVESVKIFKYLGDEIN